MKHIGLTLFIIAIICVPIMLVPKPFVLKAIHQANEAKEGKHVEATQEHSLEDSNTAKGNEQGELDLLSLIRTKKEARPGQKEGVIKLVNAIIVIVIIGYICTSTTHLR
jgi:hypothetical protein